MKHIHYILWFEYLVMLFIAKENLAKPSQSVFHSLTWYYGKHEKLAEIRGSNDDM